MEKILWISKLESNEAVSAVVELSTKILFFEPEKVQCFYGRKDDTITNLLQDNIEKISEEEKTLEETIKDFEPTIVIVIGNLNFAQTYHDSLDNEHSYRLISYLFITYPFVKEENILPILEKSDEIIVPSLFMN